MIYLLVWDGLSGNSHYFWEAQFKIMCAQYIWFGLLCTLCGGQVFVYIPGNPLGKYTLILLPLDYWRLVERRPLCGKYQYYEHLTKHYMYWRGLVEHFAKSLFTFWTNNVTFRLMQQLQYYTSTFLQPHIIVLFW